MEQRIAVSDQDVISIEVEKEVKKRREKMYAEKVRKIYRFLPRVASLPEDQKFFEIKKEFGFDIYIVSEELRLDCGRLAEIIAYRVMCKEPCIASELNLCVFGYRDLITKEKCSFCQGHGTAEWDRDKS